LVKAKREETALDEWVGLAVALVIVLKLKLIASFVEEVSVRVETIGVELEVTFGVTTGSTPVVFGMLVVRVGDVTVKVEETEPPWFEFGVAPILKPEVTAKTSLMSPTLTNWMV